MKVTVYSDLHLEFGSFEPDEGEVCVLAGDICTAEDADNPAYERFWKRIGERFDKVFYVMGNHEHYHHDFDATDAVLRTLIPTNTTLLNNEVVEYNGVNFIGTTLWSDFKGAKPDEMNRCHSVMNDYRIIWLGENNYSPHDALYNFDEAISFFNNTLPELKGKKVVITHHAPSFESLNKNYGTQTPGAYASDLTHLIEYHSPDLWIHGHIHESNDYMIGNTRIISNPRGYIDHAVNPNFNPFYTAEV